MGAAGGLDDGVGVTDGFDEGGVGGWVAFEEADSGVAAEFGGEFGGRAEQDCDCVVFVEAG